MQIKIKGIVIKLRDIKDYDKLITILCEEYGIIEIWANGIKRSKNNLLAVCQLFSYAEFVLFKSKNKYTLSSAQSLDMHYNIRYDAVRMSAAAYFCELTEMISPDSQNSGEMVRLMLNTLYLLENEKYDAAHLKAVYELRALSIAGHMPDFVACTVCGVHDKDMYYFYPQDGYVICDGCMPYHQQETDIRNNYPLTAVPVYKPVYNAVRHILYSPNNKIFSFRLPEIYAQQLNYIAEVYVCCQTQRDYNSLSVLNSFLNQSRSDSQNTDVTVDNVDEIGDGARIPKQEETL